MPGTPILTAWLPQVRLILPQPAKLSRQRGWVMSGNGGRRRMPGMYCEEQTSTEHLPVPLAIMSIAQHSFLRFIKLLGTMSNNTTYKLLKLSNYLPSLLQICFVRVF